MIVPKAAALRLPLGGARKFVRLSRLNASTRNCDLRPDADGQRELLRRDEVDLPEAGPRTLLRSALPNGWLGSVGIDDVARR